MYIYCELIFASLDMMEAMEASQLFDRGEYMVIFVDMMSYSEE